MKPTRKVTYRKWDCPCIMLEGKWLTKKYGWRIGDTVNVKFNKDSITICQTKHG